MRKDPTEFRERFAKWKAGEKVYENGLPAYGGGKSTKKGSYYLPGEKTRRELDVPYDNSSSNLKRRYDYKYVQAGKDNGWERITDDEMSDVFLNFVARPKSRGGNTDTYNWNKQWALKGEPGLEIVSPEFDILALGAGARINAATQAFLKSRKIANAIAKGIKENAVITGYNRNPVTKELGTLWDYQSYLDNVFPNSKIKDVLWHGSTKKNLLSFSTEYIGSNMPIKKSVGMYLAPEKTTAASYGRKGDIYPVLLNTENPFITNQFFGGISKNGINIARISPKTRSTILANNDAVIAPARGEIAFFEPNDALILGSERDVEGFRRFMSSPQITAENAASMTPEQWTAAQDAAIARGDMAEAQRLRDLHFKVSAPNTKVVDGAGNPQLVIHKTPNDFTVFDNSRSIGNLNWAATPKAFGGKDGVFATGAGTNPKEMHLYVNMKNPHYPTIDEGMEPAFINESEDGILGIVDKDMTDFYKSALDAGEGFHMSLGVDNPYALKSANAVTFDNNGIRIPLGKRDNFNIADIRYGIIPPIIGYSLYNKYAE